MTFPSRPAGIVRTILAALLAIASLAVSPLAFADCDNKNCDRTAGGLGRACN